MKSFEELQEIADKYNNTHPKDYAFVAPYANIQEVTNFLDAWAVNTNRNYKRLKDGSFFNIYPKTTANISVALLTKKDMHSYTIGQMVFIEKIAH